MTVRFAGRPRTGRIVALISMLALFPGLTPAASAQEAKTPSNLQTNLAEKYPGLRALVVARGNTGAVDVELIKPTHNPRLNQLLLDALRKWRFFPAMKNGEAVESTQDIRVHFNVD